VQKEQIILAFHSLNCNNGILRLMENADNSDESIAVTTALMALRSSPIEKNVMNLKQIIVLDGTDITPVDSESVAIISMGNSSKLKWENAEIPFRISTGLVMKSVRSSLSLNCGMKWSDSCRDVSCYCRQE
jgi:hypothetical protein